MTIKNSMWSGHFHASLVIRDLLVWVKHVRPSRTLPREFAITDSDGSEDGTSASLRIERRDPHQAVYACFFLQRLGCFSG